MIHFVKKIWRLDDTFRKKNLYRYKKQSYFLQIVKKEHARKEYKKRYLHHLALTFRELNSIQFLIVSSWCSLIYIFLAYFFPYSFLRRETFGTLVPKILLPNQILSPTLFENEVESQLLSLVPMEILEDSSLRMANFNLLNSHGLYVRIIQMKENSRLRHRSKSMKTKSKEQTIKSSHYGMLRYQVTLLLTLAISFTNSLFFIIFQKAATIPPAQVQGMHIIIIYLFLPLNL